MENLHPQTTYDFRFGAKNLVGFSEWGAAAQFTMPARGPPEAPRINTKTDDVLNYVVNISSPTRFEVSWFLPEDNGDPIDFFEISFFPVRRTDITSANSAQDNPDSSRANWKRIGDVFRTEVSELR